MSLSLIFSCLVRLTGWDTGRNGGYIYFVFITDIFQLPLCQLISSFFIFLISDQSSQIPRGFFQEACTCRKCPRSWLPNDPVLLWEAEQGKGNWTHKSIARCYTGKYFTSCTAIKKFGEKIWLFLCSQRVTFPPSCLSPFLALLGELHWQHCPGRCLLPLLSEHQPPPRDLNTADSI